METRPFSLEAGGGEVIRGEVRIGARTEGGGPVSLPRTAIVVIHGFKGFRRWGFFPHLASSLADEGHSVVTFDFSRNGVGAGGDDFDELEAFAKNTFTRELEEVAQVVRTLEGGGLPVPPPDRIGLLGHSRGGGTAILAARELGSSIHGLVTWAAVATFDRWAPEVKEEWRRKGRITIRNARTGQDMPLDVALLQDLEEHPDRLDILAAARDLHQPWCIVHGTEDEAVSVRDAERLHALAPSARLALVDGAGHTFGATHPFGGETAHLRTAIRRSRSHLKDALGARGSKGAAARPST